MARINIEDSLFKDVRFTKLCIKFGCRRTALGALVEAWMLAQQCVSVNNPEGSIPETEWNAQEIANEIVDVKLASKHNGLVTITGGAKNFAWLVQRQEAGKSRSEKKLETLKQFQNQDPNDRLSTAERTEVENRTETERVETAPEPLTLSPTLSLNLNKNINAQNKFERFDFLAVYDLFPKRVGKKRGIQACQVQIKTQAAYQDLIRAVSAYKAYCLKNKVEDKSIKQFDRFMEIWTDWLDPEAGTLKEEFRKKDEINWDTFRKKATGDES